MTTTHFFVNNCKMEKNIIENNVIVIPQNLCSKFWQSGPDLLPSPFLSHFLKLINTSKQRICIQTPYFTPNKQIFHELCNAAQRGVKVEIMFPKMADKKLLHKTSLGMLSKIHQNGVEVYFYRGFLHSKLCLFDQATALFGTINMDVRSFEHNFELCGESTDNKFVCALLNIFEDDKKQCEKCKKDWHARQPFLGFVFYELF